MIVPDERPTRDALGYPKPVRSFREHLTWIVPLAIVINLPVLILGLSGHGRADGRDGATKVAAQIEKERRLSCEAKMREALDLGTSCLDAIDELERNALACEALLDDAQGSFWIKRSSDHSRVLQSIVSSIKECRPSRVNARVARCRVAPSVDRIRAALAPTGDPFTPSDDLLNLLIKESAAAIAGSASYEQANRMLAQLPIYLPPID